MTSRLARARGRRRRPAPSCGLGASRGVRQLDNAPTTQRHAPATTLPREYRGPILLVCGARFLLMSGLLEASKRPLRGGCLAVEAPSATDPVRRGPPHLVLDRTGSVPRQGRCVGGCDTRWPRPAWLADAPPWRRSVRRDPRPPRCQSGAPPWRCGGIARRGPTVGLAVSGSRPPRGLPRAQPRLARRPEPPALTRWCVARGGGAARCAGWPGARAHGASPVRAAPDRRPADPRPRAVPVR